MRPTFSIILFTVLSGAGYGLWMLVGIVLATQWPSCVTDAAFSSADSTAVLCLDPDALVYAFVAGFLLVVTGLIASVGHLGKPLRAWRALSQWRTSWLSREGVSSLLTFLPAAGIVIYELMFSLQMSAAETGTTLTPWMDRRWVQGLGATLALGSLVTVFCTANIYACLKPIHGWHNRFVVPVYLLLAIYSGLLMLWVLKTLPYLWTELPEQHEARWIHVIGLGVVIFSILGAALKVRYWKSIDLKPASTTGSATGLGLLGDVRSFEQPHTEENYLTHEMGFRIARKHSRRLRLICLLAGFAVPASLVLLSLILPSIGIAAAWISLLSGLLGIFIERWLFFAEAKHAVMLYYGARSG